MSSPEADLPLRELAAERLGSLSLRFRAAALQAGAKLRPFPTDTDQRLLLVTQNERIPQSQIFPFHHFAAQLNQHYVAAVREVSLEHALNPELELPDNATTIAFQTPYDIDDETLGLLLRRLRNNNPYARMVYLDWAAPADLRNAARLDAHIDVYVKKHALRDRGQYGRETLGDTNLSDYYARANKLPEPVHRFEIPDGFLEKLVVGPSFATAPMLLPRLREALRPGPEKTIDMHARFAVGGTPWYQAMRGEAEVALEQVDDLNLAVGNTLPLYKFISELRRAKVCFSPFGYGEVCWRDYEAVMAGAVLLKPDMSHIETEPDIFRPWETYVPLRWDLADLGEKLRYLLSDPGLRHSLAARAHGVLHDYLNSDAFAVQMRPLFRVATS